MEKEDKKLENLEKFLGIAFKEKSWLIQALTHRSYLNEVKSKELKSNERLEFLGDAILSFWISSEIFKRFPDFPEGQLTFIRTYLVRTETLAGLAKKLALGKYLYMSRGEELSGGRENPSLLANTFEALIGAIFIDQGLKSASDFLRKQFFPLLEGIKNVESLKDSKSLFQEIVQAQGYPSPVYKLHSAEGPDHQKIFTMGVYINEKLIAEGTSRSKQEAEEEAAKKALEIFKKEKDLKI